MPDASSLQAWLTLSLIDGLGGEGARKLLKEFTSPEVILSATHAELSRFVRPAVASAIINGVDSSVVDIALHWSESPGNHIVTLGDPNYPAALLDIPDPPTLLYVKGQVELLQRPAFAIVGSRNATPQGMLNAEAFSHALSSAGLCVVSGLAHGIDAAAHRGALRGSGSTIAVVGTGLDRVYPSAHRDLAHTLAIHGALVSEYPLGTPPIASNFPRRNRLISGLSLGCLVVEASLQSGSLITARLSAEQGREVYAIPGSIHSPQSKGCHRLLKQGAKLVENSEDLLEDLAPMISSPDSPVTSVHDAPSGFESLLEFIGFDPVGLDALVSRSGLTLVELSSMLLELELSGRVSLLPGGFYQRKQ